MKRGQSYAIEIREASQVGEARRVTANIARDAGLDEEEAGRVGIIVSEAAGNLVKHATTGGDLLVRMLEREGVHGVEIIAVDRGPGLNNPDCLRDGYSTAGTLGAGLGAIQRQSDEFHLYSRVEQGTSIVSRVWKRPTAQPVAAFRYGVINVPMSGEELCGDGWAVDTTGKRARFMVSDGLGHGPGASEASERAVTAFALARNVTLVSTIERMHDALRGSRGAAIAIAEIDRSEGTIRFAGIGNISAILFDGNSRRSLVSQHGIVGYQMRKVQDSVHEWTNGSLLILHSDGLKDRWDLGQYAGLQSEDPSLIGATIYRDAVRKTDDATVFVVRDARP